MIEAIVIITFALAGLAAGYALRASEIAMLRDALRREKDEKEKLQDCLFYKNNLPSMVGETKRLAAVSAPVNPNRTPERYDDGPPDLFEYRAKAAKEMNK